jgi:hypothetical protein
MVNFQLPVMSRPPAGFNLGPSFKAFCIMRDLENPPPPKVEAGFSQLTKNLRM